MTKESKMFAFLLKFWRNKRGLSQLDLSLKADVSTRHISFLETGRSQPSKDMVLRLVEALGLALRDRNTLLQEAGFDSFFPEPDLSALDQPGTRDVLSLMMQQQEPYPLVVMNRWYDILSMNRGAKLLLKACLGERLNQLPQNEPLNAVTSLFRDDLFKPVVIDWENAAMEIIARLHRELLHSPQDHKLSALITEVLSVPGIPDDWRKPDLSRGGNAVFPFRFQAGKETLEFVTTLTVFSTPRNVTLQELQIESYFPLNADTKEAWSRIIESMSR